MNLILPVSLCRLRQLGGLFALAYLLTGLTWSNQAFTADRVESKANVSSRQLELEMIEKDLRYFAADAMEGRDTGSQQLKEAAVFLRGRLDLYGYTTPKADEDGYQEFSIPGRPALGKNNSLTIGSEETITSKIDQDFRPCSFGNSGEFSAPVVFCGYGIFDPDNGFNEFADVDLKGKVALVMRRVPRQNKFDSQYVSKTGSIDIEHASLRSKVRNAQDEGAVAVLVVNDPFSTKKNPDQLFGFGYGGQTRNTKIPVMQITINLADQLVKAGLGKSLQELEAEIDAGMKPVSQELKGITTAGQVDIDSANIETGNVIAVLEPRDSDIKETIIIGAHYDHVGWGSVGSLAVGTKAIHNGADDNGSGSIALLTLAKRLAPLNGKLDRRIVLIWFAAEEKGLLGSKHYVDEPLYPLEDTIAMLNLDMVGRICDEKLTVFGVGSAPQWNPWLDTIEKETGLNFFREMKAFGPSDHASFYEKEIPVLHLFSGLHEDYHRPTDDFDEINYGGMQRVVDVLEPIVLNLANLDQRPEVTMIDEWIRVGKHAGGLPNVGLLPNLNDQQAGMLLDGVVEGSPAAKAGLQQGDRIQSVDDQPVQTRADFWNHVKELEPGTSISVQVTRADQPVDIPIKLGPPR